MDQDPKSEAEARERIQKLRETQADRLDKPEQVVDWLISTTNRYETVFSLVSPVLSDVLQKNSLSVDTTLKTVNFYKRYAHKCKGEFATQFVIVGLAASGHCQDVLSAASDSLLTSIRGSVYSHDDVLAQSIEAIRTVVVPRMKTLADHKRFGEALSMWRAIVKFTRFEKVPTTVTNKILHVATMAFKESDPKVHVDAFNSWKLFIERLPEATVRKWNYVALLLNPLNRVYRETFSEAAVHKFATWWQLVLSLKANAASNFDQVVVPLVQKVFNLPSSRANQSKSGTDGVADACRPVSHEAYAVLALLLYSGNNEILREMNNLHDKLPVNAYVFGDEHFVKHSTLVHEVVAVVVNNIVHQMSPPPKIYAYLLLKILVTRASSLHNSDALELSRAFISCALKLLFEIELDAEQSLGVFSDLANGAPQKLLMTPHFVPEFSETLIAVLTAFFVNNVSTTCSLGTENHRKRFRSLLRVLLERATSDFLPFTDYFISRFNSVAPSLEVPSWTELVERLVGFIGHNHEVNQGSELEHDFSAIIKCLRYPFRKASSLTAETVKLWSKLFTVFAANAVLVKGVSQNQHIGEVCRMLLEELERTEISLHCMMLYSQALEVVVKQVTPQVTSLVGSSKKELPFGQLDAFVKCLSLLAKSSFQFISDEKQPKNDCQFFVNVVAIFLHLIHNSDDLRLCKELCNALIPDILPLFEFTKTRNVIRETCLSQVEAPLTNALGHLSQELVAKASLLADDGDFTKRMRTLLDVASGHWKRSIRDTFCSYANSISVPIGDGDQSSQNLSQFVCVSDAVAPVIPPKTATTTTTTTVAAAAATVSEKTTPVVKRRSSRNYSKALDDEDFTPIRDARKKPIFTEHQLEKRAESKLIPSMYQDLSQSVDDKNSQQQPQQQPAEPQIESSNAPVPDEDAKFGLDAKPLMNVANGSGLGDGHDAATTTAAVTAADADEEPKTCVTASCNDLDIEGIRPIDSALDQAEAPPAPPQQQPLVECVNNENDEPVAKKKKRFSYNENDEILEQIEINQQPSSLLKMAEKIQQQQQLDRGELDGSVAESPMRGFATRKRKLGQNFESPILSRLPPKNGFLANSPSSRSRKMLEAAQAKHSGQTDIRHMLAGSTPRHNNVLQLHDSPQAAGDERRTALAVGSVNCSSTGTGAGAGAVGVQTSPPSTRRSILKRFSTGASAKRVSFSKSNEVCAFSKHPRISTAKSLFPPVTVVYDEDSAVLEECEASPRVDLCEKSFHEDQLEGSSAFAVNDNTLCASTAENSVHLELLASEEDSPVKKVLFETKGDHCDEEEHNVLQGLDADEEEFVDAMGVSSDFAPAQCSTPDDVVDDDDDATTTKPADLTEARVEEAAAPAPAAVTAQPRPKREAEPEPEPNLVDSIKAASDHQRKQVLAYVSSPEFLATMTSNERNAFAIRVFASIGFYVQ